MGRRGNGSRTSTRGRRALTPYETYRKWNEQLNQYFLTESNAGNPLYLDPDDGLFAHLENRFRLETGTGRARFVAMIRDILEDPLATSPPATTAPPTEEETGEAPVEPTAEETEEALPAPEIDSLSLIALPDGESPDHTDQEDRLIDGDTSDFWSTQHYASPDYGGLKEGVGIRLQFAEPSTFKALTVTTARNNGGLIELRTVNEDGSPGEVLASGEFVADGEVRLEAPEEMETDKVMLWIPELPPDSAQQGRFRARIAEIQAE